MSRPTITWGFLLCASVVWLGAQAPSAAKGPYAAKDIARGGASSDPIGWVQLGEVVLFTATDERADIHAASASAQPAYRVADLDASPGSNGSYVDLLMAARGKAFFTAETRDGREVWATNGTAAGTEFLADACPGGCSSIVEALGTVEGITLWQVGSQGSGYLLMRSDGTRAGTYRLAGPDGDLRLTGSPAVVAHGPLILPGTTADAGGELWQSDGTEAGTVRIADIEPGPYGSEPDELAVVGSKIFFTAGDSEGARALYVIAGAGATPSRLIALPWGIETLAATPTRVFFVVDTFVMGELWTSDGTVAGTRRVASLPEIGTFGVTNVWLKPYGERVLFVADDGVHGKQVWRSDGTQAGTVRLTDLPPASASLGIAFGHVEAVGGRVLVLHLDRDLSAQLVAVTGPGEPPVVLFAPCPGCGFSSSLQRVGERVVFRRTEPEVGTHLWTTDGTPAGTQRLAELCPTVCSSSDVLPVLASGHFFALDAAGNTALQRTDGTVSGTRVVSTVPTGVEPIIRRVAVIGDRVLFAGYEADRGYSLWTSGRTRQETRRVATVVAQRPSSMPRELTALGDRLLFSAAPTGSLQPQLWSSLGSAETTEVLTELVPTSSSPPGPAHLTPVGDKVFFWIDTHEARPLWRSDGTPAGTFPLLADQRLAAPPAVLDGQPFYVLADANGAVVWKTDGTEAGTQPAFELPAGVSAPRHLTAVGDQLYFPALSVDGTEVWRSDGTTEGVQRVTAFADDFPFHEMDPSFVLTSGGVVFRARDAFADTVLWSTDGTPQSTHQLVPTLQLQRPRPLGVVGGSLYFFADQATGRELWRTDGTDGGTVLLRELTDPYLLDRSTEAVRLGAQLFFAADDGTHGLELWTTDGTAAGTRLVADLAPGAAGSSPRWLAVAGGVVYFSAHDGVHGFELWRTDGTAAGTRLVHDIAPGAASSYPQELTLAGSRLYFSADDLVVGEELWALDLGAVPGPCVASPTALCLGGHFRVEAMWVVGDQMSNGRAVPLTADTGAFWFFGPENVEVVLKVLDGRPVNEHHWVFYGALSDVEYHLTVTDTETGLTRRYVNPGGQLASVADTNGFGRLGAFSTARRSRAGVASRVTTSAHPAAAKPGSCVPAPSRLCLRGGRFAVEATWRDFAGNSGTGTAVALTGDTGWFWFFGPSNVEVILKVLDGTPVNGKHWVFYGALSSVEYTLRVTDTTTGVVKTYTNPSGNLASVADTDAF